MGRILYLYLSVEEVRPFLDKMLIPLSSSLLFSFLYIVSLVNQKPKYKTKLTHMRNVIFPGFQARKVILKSSFTEQKERKFISRQILLIF